MSETKVIFNDYTYDVRSGELSKTILSDLLSPVTEYPFGLDRDCSICLSTFKNLKHTSKLPCGHIFDTSCIKKWLKEKKICPLCRNGPINNCPAWLINKPF